MSLLPLKCFKSFMYLGPFTCANKKSSCQGRIGLASAKTDPPSGARRGGTPSASKFSSEKSFTRTTFALFDCVDNIILKTSKRDLERQGRPSRGTPTPPGYGYLTYHLPRKVAHARISDSATEQVLTLENFSTKTTFRAFRLYR
jgi:hypothetical protein